MLDKNWDLIVVGGGTSGWPAALAAARNNIDVLLIEEEGYLGGAATSTYVTPMMKTILPDGRNLAGNLYKEVMERMKLKGFADVYPDGNPGWFAPEMLKFVLDEMMEEAGVRVLFHTSLAGVNFSGKKINSINTLFGAIKTDFNASYYIDATGEAALASLAGVPFQLGKNGSNQAMSHRFIMANVDIEKFAIWLEKIDSDRGVSPIFRSETGDILLTTAYTSEDKPWALKPLFDQAINSQILKPYDADYFQIFTVPGQKGLVFFNCPRIYSHKNLSPLCPEDLSYAQIQGRKQILRLAKFCKHYIPGFENSFISNIASKIGVRDTRRIKGRYTLTINDILTARKFDNAVAKSNYPIDVHSSRENGGLRHLMPDDYYEIPLECLLTHEYDNLLVIGKSISAEFEAQASLRIQPTLITIGENAGIFASNFVKNLN